jgi:ribosomal protein S18 acetylase RimI-like enzyme
MVEAGGLTITDDVWLSGVMSRQVRRVKGPVDARKEKEAERALADVLGRTGFSYARIPTDDGRTIRLLEQCGFHLVDTGVTLETSVVREEPSVGRHVRFARPDDRAAVEGIARRSFAYSRFHLDLDIPKQMADEIKAQWAGNFFHGKRGDHMVVAEQDGRVVGFAQLLVDGGDAIIIDLIAVDGPYRGQGLAKEMIRLSASAVDGARVIRVGTQIANTPSLRVYQKLGFVIVSSSYVFHYHQTVCG